MANLTKAQTTAITEATNFAKTYAPEILATGSALLVKSGTELLICNFDDGVRKYANDLLKGFVEESCE